MPEPVSLSAVRVDPEAGGIRDCPRPPRLRNDRFHGEYDWSTLFYDVYRVGRHVVLQGPPFFNFLDHLRQSGPLRRAFAWPLRTARHVGHDKRGEIWLRSDADSISLDGLLGTFEIAVQPSEADRFAGRRVLTTLSKDNPEPWIEDWIRFYREIHGVDAVLLYDNASTRYSAGDLEARLRAAFPDLLIEVVSWPFPYGPGGGMTGAVNGVEAPWDSDFCQTGMLQHARFRFLGQARSVLNVDIDELVLGTSGRSVFEAAEAAPGGLVRFQGHWISTANPRLADRESRRHGHFILRDPADGQPCPPKWCAVPARQRRRQSWSAHNVFGTRANRHVSAEFTYRHMRAISTGWKYDRMGDSQRDLSDYVEDGFLRRAFHQARIATD